jgi:hypothetical protein
MPAEACSATVHHGYVGRNAHFVDVSTRINIVKRIEDDVEALEKVDVESRIFDVRMVGLDVDVRVELARCLFCYL